MFRVLLSDGNRDEMLLCVATNILNVKIIRCRFVRNFIRIFEHHITAQCHKDQTGQQVFVQLLQKNYTTTYFIVPSQSSIILWVQNRIIKDHIPLCQEDVCLIL